MSAARLSRLSAAARGEALLHPAGSEIRRLVQVAHDALDEAARLADERERRERGAETREPIGGDVRDLRGVV